LLKCGINDVIEALLELHKSGTVKLWFGNILSCPCKWS
jgi:hypothetical protein